DLRPALRQLAPRHLPVRFLRRQRPRDPQQHRHRQPAPAGGAQRRRGHHLYRVTMRFTHLTRRGGTLAGLLVALALVACLAGCGSGIYPVEGEVVWKDGSPAKELQNSRVIFDLPEKQTRADGIIQADGTFRLTTNKPGDGALPGEYKVLIVEGARKRLGGPDSTALAPGFMDSRYSDPRTTDLKATVTTGPNRIKLTVERAQKR